MEPFLHYSVVSFDDVEKAKDWLVEEQ